MERQETVASAPLAALQQVQVHYAATTALYGIELQVRPGQVMALLGRNGAGKSTAIAVLLGLRRPDARQAWLLGGDAGRERAVHPAGGTTPAPHRLRWHDR